MSAVERFSTRLVPIPRRQLYWRELVAETFPGMVADVPEGIMATLARWSLGRIGLAHALSERAHITRSGVIDQVDQEFDGIIASAARIACTNAGHGGDLGNVGRSPLDYALRNLADPELGTARISEVTGLSPRAVQKAFLRHAGLTPTAFITERRLQRAAELLGHSDERTITDVAFEVGFSDSAFFSRCFRRRFGEAPRQWRGRAETAAHDFGPVPDFEEVHDFGEVRENGFASVQ